MNTPSTALYSLDLRSARSLLIALIFIAGNIILPQAVHLIPNGGHIWLPIYFFTLIAAYKYGWRIGLLTAVLSPVVNSLLFGMPATALLPSIILKSTALAIGAAYAARLAGKVSIAAIIAAVFFCQIVGGTYEWLTGSFTAAIHDITIGLPGIVLQISGCWFILRHILRE